MIYLDRYKSQTGGILFLSHAAAAVLTSAAWLLLTNLTELSSPAVALTAILIGLVGAAASGAIVYTIFVKPAELLVQAILYVSKDNNKVAAPDLQNLVYARALVQHVVNVIYDLAAQSQTVQDKMKGEFDYMRTVLSATPLPVIVLDHNKTVQYINNAAALLVNKSVEKPVGSEFDIAFNVSFPNEKTLGVWIDRCQNSNIKALNNWERIRVQADDKVKMFDMMASFNKEESHGIETIIMLFDHTDRYQADDSEVNFVSLAVHELRSPITVLKGYIEVFEDELGPSLSEEQKEFMYKMSVSAAQLSTFVNNILNVARIDNDQMKVHLAEEDWLKMLKDTAEEFATRVALRGRRLKLQIPAEMPTVAVDKISIYEVLSNLIDNATKYSFDGGEIIIKCEEKDGMVETTVTDHGIGIPASVIEHVFSKFYRSHRSRDNVGGTGLGLYLSKAIVEAHGGSIWVRSTEGDGATFGFTLPYYASVADKLKNADTSSGEIVRSAHGWIKNHSMIRK